MNALKVRYVSDIHIGQYQNYGMLTVADIVKTHEDDFNTVLILGGDNFHMPSIENTHWCDNITQAFTELSKRFKAVLYVMGNHEYYSKNNVSEVDDKFTEISDQFDNVHRLHDDMVVIIEGYAFIGNILWTDVGTQFATDNITIQREDAGISMADYHLSHVNGEKMSPHDTQQMFFSNIRHIENNLIQYKDYVTVVVTHHAPSEKSSLLKFKNSVLNVYFKSDLEDFIKEHRPAVWVHGHMHNTSQYTIGDTVVLANPHGYGRGLENLEFDIFAHFYLTEDGYDLD